MKVETKQTKQKLGFLGSDLCVQEQASVCRQDYAYTSSCPENLKNTIKPKTLKLTP